MADTSQTITGKDGTADVQYTPSATDVTPWTGGIKSYKCILDMFRVREVTEMTTSDTFCVEGVADQDPGRSQLQGEFTGLGKKKDASAGPWIPAPQGGTLLLTYSAGCTISFKANFTESTADRMVNNSMRISARFLSKGVYVVTWDRTPPP